MNQGRRFLSGFPPTGNLAALVQIEKAKKPARESRTHLDAWNTLVKKSNRLDGCDVETLAAAEVLAHQDVVFAQHVGAGFGKAGAVTVIGAGRQAAFLGTDDPVDLVFRRLVEKKAIETDRLLVGTLVEKFALFHKSSRRSLVLGRWPRSN